MTITITAFERSPDGGKGLARGTRVRWALEEVGQRYEVRLVSFRAMKEPAHLALHPFGQIPTGEEGDLACSRQGRSCYILPSAMRACCRMMPMRGRARSHGCLPRSTRWSRRSLNSQPPGFWRAISPDVCLWSRIASVTG
jgi:glutathione S-transferase